MGGRWHGALLRKEMSFPCWQKGCSSGQGPSELEGRVYMQGQCWVGSRMWRLCIYPDAAAEVGLGLGYSEAVPISSCASQATPSREKSLAWSLHWWQMCAQSLLNHTLSHFYNGLAPGPALMPMLLGPLDGCGCSLYPLRVQWLVAADDSSTSREPLMAWALSGACIDSGTASSTTQRFKWLLKQLQCVESAPGPGKMTKRERLPEKNAELSGENTF